MLLAKHLGFGGEKPPQSRDAPVNSKLLSQRYPSKISRGWSPSVVVWLAVLILAAVSSVPAMSRGRDGPGRNILQRSHKGLSAGFGSDLVLLGRGQGKHKLGDHDERSCFPAGVSLWRLFA